MVADERLAVAIAEDHPDVAARLLERAPAADAAAFLATLSPPAAAGALRTMSPGAAAECCAMMPEEVLAVIVAALPLDASALVARRIAPARRDTVLAHLPDGVQRQLRRRLAYPERSAGAIADPLVLAVPEDVSVADAQRELHAAGGARHVLNYIYVVARDQRLVGVLDIAELMGARASEPIAGVMRRDVVTMDANADLATVAAHPAWRHLDALPVVDPAGHLVGAIRHKVVRQMEGAKAQSVLATLVGLSELYWAGLSGVLTSIAVARDARGGADAPHPRAEPRDAAGDNRPEGVNG